MLCEFLEMYPYDMHAILRQDLTFPSTQCCSMRALQLLRTAEGKPLSDKQLWQRSDLDAGQLVNEFQRECHVVRRSIDGDLVKVPSCPPTVVALPV